MPIPKRITYHQQTDGEWVQLKSMKGYKLGCCDCGLIHTLDFRIVKGKIQFRAFRDNRATAQRRRHRLISITRGAAA